MDVDLVVGQDAENPLLVDGDDDMGGSADDDVVLVAGLALHEDLGGRDYLLALEIDDQTRPAIDMRLDGGIHRRQWAAPLVRARRLTPGD